MQNSKPKTDKFLILVEHVASDKLTINWLKFLSEKKNISKLKYGQNDDK